MTKSGWMRRISERIVGRTRGHGAPCAVGRLSPPATKTKSPVVPGDTTGALMLLMVAASVIASKKFMFADLGVMMTIQGMGRRSCSVRDPRWSLRSRTTFAREESPFFGGRELDAFVNIGDADFATDRRQRKVLLRSSQRREHPLAVSKSVVIDTRAVLCNEHVLAQRFNRSIVIAIFAAIVRLPRFGKYFDDYGWVEKRVDLGVFESPLAADSHHVRVRVSARRADVHAHIHRPRFARPSAHLGTDRADYIQRDIDVGLARPRHRVHPPVDVLVLDLRVPLDLEILGRRE